MIERLASLNKKIDAMKRIDLEKPVGKAIGLVQETAKSGCPFGDGELKSKIFTDIKLEEEDVLGICYTDVAHRMYVEFGTGPKGQANHAGTSPNVAVAYSQSPWWIHESQIDKETAEKYHFFSIETPDGVFYQSAGQPAQPFMYPALKDHIDDVVEIISKEIKKQL